MMDHRLPCLHPNPGWIEFSDDGEIVKSSDAETNQVVGKHCILELYDCDATKLDDEAFLRTTINLAAREAGATLLNLITHRFIPQGVTGLALLAESHISIHTWPENGYAAVDVFTCGHHTKPEVACEVIKIELEAKRCLLSSLKRETPTAFIESKRDPFKR